MQIILKGKTFKSKSIKNQFKNIIIIVIIIIIIIFF